MLNIQRALPVGLCWMKKRNGRSRVISSTAIRENITAAGKANTTLVNATLQRNCVKYKQLL